MDTYLAQHTIRIGRGEPMLLLHGLGHCKEGWEPVLPGLGARFDVAALDLPGFGGADPLPVTQSDVTLTDFCEEVMDALGWQSAHIVGNSLGGLIALRLADRGRARSVTALSPAGKAVGWEHTWARGLLRVMRAIAPAVSRIPAATDTALGRTIAMRTVFGKPKRMTSGYARASLSAIQRATRFDETLANVELHTEDLKPSDAPITIAWGTEDLLLLPPQGRRWAEAIPGSRLIKLAGLGHTPMPDDPDMVVDVISRTAAASQRLQD